MTNRPRQRHWRIGLCVAVAWFAITPAAAHWEYAFWGMSEAQLVAASSGAARPLPEAQHRPVPDARMTYRVEGRYIERDLTLRLAFAFDNVTGGLVCLSYTTETPEQAQALRDWLIQRFGRPVRAMRDPATGEQNFTWREPDNIDLQIVPRRIAVTLHCARGT